MNPSFPAPVVGNSVPELNATFSQTSAQSVYLTAASYGLQAYSMTTLGQSIFLPPIVDIVPGTGKFGFKNNGVYPFGIRDSVGNLLTSITGGGFAYFSLDNSGNWSFTGSGLEPGLLTIDGSFGSTFTSNVFAPYVALDNNTSIHFAQITTNGFAAFVVDNLGRTVTTPVTVSTASNDHPVAAFKVSATSAIVFFGPTSTTQKVVVLTLTGASPSLSLSVGTIATFTTPGASITWSNEDSIGSPKIVQLTPTLYLAAVIDTPALRVIAASVSGATVTLGATAQIIASTLAGDPTAYALTPTTGIIIYNSGTLIPFASNAVVVSVAGTTCTVGTPASGNPLSASNTTSNTLLSPTKAIVLGDNNTTTTVQAQAITIAGTVVTFGTGLNVETGGTGVGIANTGYTAGGSNRYIPKLFPIGTNSALLWYFDTNFVSRAVILSESAGTLTSGGLFYRSISTTAGSDGYGLPFPQSPTEFLTFRLSGQPSSTNFPCRLVPNKISGTTVTAGSGKFTNPDELTVQESLPTNFSMARLPSGDYLFGPTITTPVTMANSSVPVYRSNGDVVVLRGIVKVPTVATSTFVMPVIGNNRLVLMGATTFGTTLGLTTYQLRVFNLEIAQ